MAMVNAHIMEKDNNFMRRRIKKKRKKEKIRWMQILKNY